MSAFDHIMFKVKLQNAKTIQNIPLRLEDVVSSNEKYKIYYRKCSTLKCIDYMTMINCSDRKHVNQR